jgi:hypothetical protein
MEMRRDVADRRVRLCRATEATSLPGGLPDRKAEKRSSDTGVPGTAAFGKFMRVLQIVADADGPLRVTQLAALTGLPRPTFHPMAAALLAEGMIAQVPDAGTAWVLADCCV